MYLSCCKTYIYSSKREIDACLRDKKSCFSLATLIGKFVFESGEEKRASKDIVS